MLIRAYRIRGHLIANLDPLSIQKKEEHPELKPETYGFERKDYDRKILEKACEKIHRESCMNIFSVKAIAIASYFKEFFPLDKNKNLTSVSFFFESV